MNKVLKYGSIGLIIAGLVFSAVFFFGFLPGVSGVKLFHHAKGFESFVNTLYYPNGFIVLLIVYLFAGIVTVIFMFDDDKNFLVATLQLVTSILMFIWFAVLFTGGKQYFKRTIEGYDYKINGYESHQDGLRKVLERAQENLDFANDRRDGAEKAITDQGGDIDKLDDIRAKKLELSDVNSKLANNPTETARVKLEAQKADLEAYLTDDTLTYFKKYENLGYYDFVDARNNLKSKESAYDIAERNFKSATRARDSINPLFIISFIFVAGAAIQYVWYFIDFESFEQ